MKEYKLFPVILNLFDGNTNVTTQTELSPEMKTFYAAYLIDMAEPNLIHDQAAMKYPIPKNGGKTIEFRKFASLPKARTALDEGVTPNGQKLNVSTVTGEVKQYGGFVEISDMLSLTSVDNCLVEAMSLLAGQAGRTLDTITREVLNGGTNVQYGEGKKTMRNQLSYVDENNNDNLTVNAIRKAVRTLKAMNAPKINGYYLAFINQDVSYDLMSDPKWVNVKSYSDPDGIFEGEIGKIEGVRFIESSECRVWKGAGANGRDVYSTLIVGANAYAVTEITGGGLQTIVKQLGSAGTADPLDLAA